MEFTSHTGQHNPPLGQFLGQFKDELDGNDSLKNLYRATRNKATKHIKKMYAAESEAFHSAEAKEALDEPPETRVPKTCQTSQIKPDAKNYELFAQYCRLVFKINAWSTLTRSRFGYMERGTINGTR